jgi:hypothetical protein
MTNLAETMQRTAREARVTEAELEREHEADQKRKARNEQRRRQRAANSFADKLFDGALKDITHDIQEQAGDGAESLTRNWLVHDKTPRIPDSESIERYQALRAKIAEDLTGKGFFIETADKRPEARDMSIPLSDGYSPDYPPMKDAGWTVVGMTVSWASAE